MPDLVRAPAQHRTPASRNPDLKPSTESGPVSSGYRYAPPYPAVRGSAQLRLYTRHCQVFFFFFFFLCYVFFCKFFFSSKTDSNCPTKHEVTFCLQFSPLHMPAQTLQSPSLFQIWVFGLCHLNSRNKKSQYCFSSCPPNSICH